jgi:predicted alpha/beta superfamily hydrolase
VDATSTSNGHLRLHLKVASAHLEHPRTVIVALPPGYDDTPGRQFPVLYLQDGQNLFDPATSFIPGHYWAVDRTANALIAAGHIAPLIVVGVYNTGDHRIDEYTPTVDPRVRRGGKADLYGRFLVDELIPFISATYRTHPEPSLTGLGGSSLGGLVSLYLGLQYPHVFGRVAAMSPSAWWDRKAIVRVVKELPSRTPQRIWLDMGTREGRGLTAMARELRDGLVAKGWRPRTDLAYHEARNARHSELAWARRVGPMLQFLYGTG